MLYSVEKSILQEISLEELESRNCKLFIKRDDLIDSDVSGNKWRKLKYNIQQAQQLKQEGILTFGGAYSNHLVATAAACHKVGVKAVGIVRGDELNVNSNITLQRCADLGMHLVFVPRTKYDLRNERIYKEELSVQYPNFYQVPEGGANFYGMIGCQEIIKEINRTYDHVFVAQGTTTTSCGILLGLAENAKLNVVPVLKNYASIEEMTNLYISSVFEKDLIEELLSKVNVHQESHFGGYAKYTIELLNFIRDFYSKTKVPLDPIYTGKVMFTLFEELKKGNLDNQTVIFIHTGGVQGAQAIQAKEGIILYA
ncbi:MAG: pyridoxal-phosphate dependent enzyme [Flavobacteriia bacterium]|nr:pyridoxal-phosphate dependent enzyme [Flavobacteriia bacterium]